LPALRVKANQYIKGEFSGEKYQLDALIESIEKIVLEAKDYSVDEQKVGRPDVSKLAGALNELPIDRGIVASPTNFSRHAKKYADGTKMNPNAKPIDLLHVRHSTVEDEQGRIMAVRIELHIERADFTNAKWEPIFTKEGADLLKSMFAIGTQIHEAIRAFYSIDGSVLVTMEQLTREISLKQGKNGVVKDEWIPNISSYIKIKDTLIPIQSYRYEVPFVVDKHDLVVECNGKAVLLVKSEDGKIDKLVTDADLRKVKIKKDGSVE